MTNYHFTLLSYISIHALLAESDSMALDQYLNEQISIHALLAESDGKPRALKSRRCVFLSTLSLRRATAGNNAVRIDQIHFYPRSPCGERQRSPSTHQRNPSFLSTLSLRRATNINSSVNTADKISIHALLAESDMRVLLNACAHFVFLSTLSLRRATPRGGYLLS